MYSDHFKNYVRDVVFFVRRVIYHDEWDMHIAYSEIEEDCPVNGANTLAQITCDPTYLAFRITIYPPLLDQYNTGQLQRVAESLIHELCHLLMAPLQGLAMGDAAPSQKREVQEVTERQTQRTANVIKGLLPKDWWKPAKIKKAVA